MEIKKYTANYTYTSPNFVIQNLVENSCTNKELLPLLYVLKNILQRGCPTIMSKYLQSELGKIYEDKDSFKKRFLFISTQMPVWIDTIKGNKEHNYYPARDFFEKIIPDEFGEYAFVQSLIIPEIEINEIVGEENPLFIHQQVDFYLPQAKLVIEIDGQQHKWNEVNRVSDRQRGNYLASKGITTIRITTDDLQNETYRVKVRTILEHIRQYKDILTFYKNFCEKIEETQISEEEIKTKLLPSAIIRFQILLIELLIHNYLTLEEDWNFNIICHEDLPDFAELAINDLLIWMDNLWRLKNKHELKKPKFDIKISNGKNQIQSTTNAVNIDFSLFRRYTDENRMNQKIIFVRNDYFDYEIRENEIKLYKNYFRVSTNEPVNYNITNEDIPVLEFFLENIFDKQKFKDGQFPIIANALNRKDTIGLLPTGGGKSLCYQLSCLLQPSINFVVCPIKSLMQDQNDNLVKTLITNVNSISSDLGKDERLKVEHNFGHGRYLFVWISPERFQTVSFREKIQSILSNFSIAYAVIDEVHCLSEWGHDFRTSYLNLAKTIDKLSKDENGEGKIKFIGLTATASVNVLKDIKIEFSRQKQQLEDENIKLPLDYSRKELQFEVINDNGNKKGKITELLAELKNNEGFLETSKNGGLVFTPNVNGEYGCYRVANTLNSLYPNKVSWFSGDVPKIDSKPVMGEKEFNTHKQQVQKDFKNDLYQLLVATKAFGMGIDKENIFYTFHYGLPSSVEALYQEAGRAGRWNKSNKIAKCYVLHSHETHDKAEVDKLFDKNTTFAEMNAISNNAKKTGKDIFRQIYLFMQGQNDIAKDFEIILGVCKYYFKEKSTNKIFWNDAYSKLNINSDILQKAIFRLSLLGLVDDWTTDFRNHYEVEFNTLDEENILKSVSKYINKYEPATDVKAEILKVDKKSILEKATWYLLQWIFEYITYNRKQALKTLSDWCIDFNNSETFKQRIDNYFRVTETTSILQHIAEHPIEYKKWFDALYLLEETNEKDENGLKLKTQVYIPQIEDTIRRKKEYEKLRDSISRFLESYRNNIGLDFLSGFVRLALNEYENTDGKQRLESTLGVIKHDNQTFSEDNQTDFFGRLKELGTYLTEEQKEKLCDSIVKYHPEMLEELADYYDLPSLLCGMYEEGLNRIKQINLQLYEQFKEF